MSDDADGVMNRGAGKPPTDEAEVREAVERAQALLGGRGPAVDADDVEARLTRIGEMIRLARRLERLGGQDEVARALVDDARAAAIDLAQRLDLDQFSERARAGTAPIDDFAGLRRRIDHTIRVSRHLEYFGERTQARTLLASARAAAINLAVDILRGAGSTPGETLALAKLLDRLDEFNFAWRILDKAREHRDFGREPGERIRIVQKRALYTYKDVTQPLGKRLDEALTFLENEAELETTTDQETLGLAGAIHKRKWELTKNDRHLNDSYAYYHKGYAQKPWKDQGYTSINAAYLLDLLAQAHRALPEQAEAHRHRADDIRAEIISVVPEMPKQPGQEWLEDMWFFYSTVGEAYFGRGDFDKAHLWLVTKPELRGVRPPDWEFETTARQLAELVRIRNPDVDFASTPAWMAFRQFLSESPLGGGGDVSSEAVGRLADGKAGLALSGGGFRASLFHIGVLARLAELDVLRRVEVLSCVSGGSIVGAHYYLEVRKLLSEKPDHQIEKKDYIEIVQRLEKEFLTGVQTNIRMSVVTEAKAVRRMLHRSYSRTVRLGELYEEQLYSRVAPIEGEKVDADNGVSKRYMHELAIRPKLAKGGQWTDFAPRNHNWRREAKVPILILNAAALNTGHNWQFTASYMGEAPATIHREIDSVSRLRRKYYTEAPHSAAAPQKVRLGAAVAASSCVPGLFEPLVFADMYETRGSERPIDVTLVDGGVCDNQGVAGLIEQDCTVLFVSDGSGQIDALEAPSALALMVAMRTNGILQSRVRGTQYRELDARRGALMLNGLMFVHLKKDLDNEPVDWKNCPPELRLRAPDDREVLTKYRISKDVQRRLAAIRTDLDSFSDQEAYALMLSGYRMTECEYANRFAPVAGAAEPQAWRFRAIEHAMTRPGEAQDYLNTILDAGSSLAFKVWKLDARLRSRAQRLKQLVIAAGAVAGLVTLLVLAALLQAVWSLLGGGASVLPSDALTWLGAIITVVAVVFALASLFALLFYAVRPRGKGDAVAHFAVGAFLLFVGGPAARHHMRKYEPAYLKRGSIGKLPGSVQGRV